MGIDGTCSSGDRAGPRRLEQLTAGDHVFGLHDAPEGRLDQLAAFVRGGLAEDCRVCLFHDEPTSTDLRRQLADRGIAADADAEPRLILRPATEVYLGDGGFDPERPIQLLQQELADSRADGLSGLWVTGDATWALHDAQARAGLLEYERRIDSIIHDCGITALCLYGRARFDADELLRLLQTHPLVAYGDRVLGNMYYVPPERLRSQNTAAATLSTWLENLEQTRQREERLAEARAQMRALLDGSPLPMFLSLPGRVLEANRAAEAWFGMSVADMKRVPAEAFFSDSLRKSRYERARQVMDTGTLAVFEDEENGRVLRHHLTPVLADDGSVEALAISVLDLTEERRARAALEASERQLRSMLESTAAGYFRLDTDLRLREVNQAWLQMHGCGAAEEVVGRSLLNFKLPEDHDGARQILRRVLAGNRIQTGSFRRPRGDGSVGTHSFTLAPVREEGRVVGVEGFLIDTTEQQRRDEELRVWGQLFTNARWGMSITEGPGGRMIRVNRAYAEMHGYTPEELMGCEVSQLTAPADRHRLADVVERLERDGHHVYEAERLRKDGSTFPAQMTISTETRVEGAIGWRLAIVQDISARRRMELALRDSEALYRGLVDALPDMVARYDGEGRCIFMNQRLMDLLQLTESQVIARRPDEVTQVEPEIRRVWWEHVHGALSSPEPQAFDIELAMPQGPMAFHWRLLPERDAEGRITGLLTIAQDLTRQRQVEANYRTIFESMHDGFALHRMVYDEDGKPCDYRFVEVNPAFEVLTGLRRQDLLGHTVLEAMPQIEPTWIERYGQVVATGESATFEDYSRDMDRHYEVKAFRPFADHFAVVFADITSRKKTEQLLSQSSRLVALGEMAAGLAHELNQPLTAISVQAEAQQLHLERGREVEPERLVRWSQDLLEQVDRIRRLIEHLRDFSRDRSGASVQPLDLNEVVHQGLGFVSAQLRGRGIQLVTDLAPTLPAVIGEPYRLEQVLLNLVNNARDALDARLDAEGREVCVRTHVRRTESQEEVLLEVRDNGIGISDETRAHLFQPFFTTKEPGRGTGLGLSIAYGIVQEHDGRIECESEEGRGTCFTVALPVA